MTSELTMPKLSDSMADAVIVRWLKSPGDAFERGEGLIEVETDKATVVYEAEFGGTLHSIIAPEGSTVSVGAPIATVANGEPPARRVQSDSPAMPPAAGPRTSGDRGMRRADATPVARRTAVQLGVSLHDIVGTGPGGRITRRDVTKAAGTAAERETRGKGDVRVLELTNTQSTIARRMVVAASTVPVFTVSTDIDVSLIASLRRGAREEGGDAPSLNDFVVKATASVLRELPRFNASYVEGTIEVYSRINVGVAVATEDALLVPVVLDADRKSLAEIAADTQRLADAARRRALTPGDLQDGTFTVSNLGMLGVRSFTAIVDPPQVAILAVGGTRRAPVEAGPAQVAFRDLMTVNLTCDHRVVYGADGAEFLSRLRQLLERPLGLIL